MKRAVLILALLLLFGSGLAFFGAEDGVRTVALETIPQSAAESPASRTETSSLLLSIAYDGAALPVNEDGTVLLPVIPETGLTVTCAKGAALTKAESVRAFETGALRSVAVTVQKGARSRTLTLTETGMAVAELTLKMPGVGKDSDPIRDKKREGTLRLFSVDEAGGLRFETSDVTAKLRGGSSRSYKKKSYTLTNVDPSGDPVARSLMGLPADTKFGLNSMYEDDVKLRDVLSLGLWTDLQPEGVPSIHMRYCELYVDGVYWGLYGFQQVVSANTFRLAPDDGLAKIASDFSVSVLSRRRTSSTEVVQPLKNADAAYELLDALALLAEKDPAALERFDRESLYRYALFLQFVSGTDSVMKNIVGVCRADTGLITLAAYDTDQTFGLMWDNACPPLYMGVHPELAATNFFRGEYSPWSGLVSDELGVKADLSALWSALRSGPLDEETLLQKARSLFTLVTESGAREREQTRWPKGNHADSPAQVEAFITERLAWCDACFGGFLTDRAG